MMTDSLFDAALTYNRSLNGGSAAPAIRQLGEQLALFCDLPPDNTVSTMEDLSHRIFLARLVAISKEKDPDDIRHVEKHHTAISLYLIARREVIRQKMGQGEDAATLQGQSFPRDIEAELKRMRALLTEGWRRGGAGYVKKMSLSDQKLVAEINDMITTYYGATTFTFSGEGSPRAMTRTRMDDPDFPAPGDVVQYYPDDYRRMMQCENPGRAPNV